jgi:hypothetical protein
MVWCVLTYGKCVLIHGLVCSHLWLGVFTPMVKCVLSSPRVRCVLTYGQVCPHPWFGVC